MYNWSSSNLPGCRVVSKVEEHISEPVVYVIQSALFFWRLQDRLQIIRHNEKKTKGQVEKNHHGIWFENKIFNCFTILN